LNDCNKLPTQQHLAACLAAEVTGRHSSLVELLLLQCYEATHLGSSTLMGGHMLSSTSVPHIMLMQYTMISLQQQQQQVVRALAVATEHPLSSGQEATQSSL
jgi:hypothetical protein